ncbi:MAG: hypothetical protein A4E43_01515 [Methanosaeta sp. PtaB.Bin005]|nr:MAG: hypothetical protein A4E43_01515 [Methanosaeta sp. PtaB.Bin005]
MSRSYLPVELGRMWKMHAVWSNVFEDRLPLAPLSSRFGATGIIPLAWCTWRRKIKLLMCSPMAGSSTRHYLAACGREPDTTSRAEPMASGISFRIQWLSSMQSRKFSVSIYCAVLPISSWKEMFCTGGTHHLNGECARTVLMIASGCRWQLIAT